jgi:hypothetical protein
MAIFLSAVIGIQESGVAEYASKVFIRESRTSISLGNLRQAPRFSSLKAFAASPDGCRHSVRISHGP